MEQQNWKAVTYPTTVSSHAGHCPKRLPHINSFHPDKGPRLQTETEGQDTKYSKVTRLVQGWDGFETWETSWSVRRWGCGAEQGAS